MKILSVIAFFIISVNIHAQDLVKRRNAVDKLVFGINYDTWLKHPANIKPDIISPGINLFFMHDSPLGIGNVGIGWGIGWASHNVHSNGAIVYKVDSISGSMFTSLDPIMGNYKKNKFVCNYIDIPLELRIRNKHNLYIALGGKAGYLINNHTKVVDDAGKRKIYRIENLQRFRYGLTIRIGYKRINFYAFYSLVPLFEKDKGVPDMFPISIGISTKPF